MTSWGVLAVTLAAAVLRAGDLDESVGAANAFRPHELIRKGREDGQSPQIEYRLLWPEQGTPPEALARVRAELWNAWAGEPDEPAAVPPVPEPAAVPRVMAAMADRLAARFREFRRTHPDVPGVWSDVRRVEMVSRQEPWLSITVAREWFFGGAHPTRRIEHLLFDLQTGRRLAPDDLFGREGREEFTRRVRCALQTARAGAPDASAAGVAIFPDAAIVPTNWFVDHRGFGVTFNEGEIAPRVAGPITVHLARDEIADLLRRASPKDR